MGGTAALDIRTMGRAPPRQPHSHPSVGCPERQMAFLIVLAALCFLMFVAYRGYSVILFAPVAALGAVLLTDPQLVAPMFTGLFMDKMVGFLKLYFPVFLLGALFGKVIELSGFSKSIVAATIRVVGAQRAMLSIVLVCALLTYGGVSLFVVVFAVYPFAAELFRQSDIPKRLIPGTIALGAFTFTMDALPGTPQIQNIIPTTFFGTDTWAAPVLGTLGGIFILILGMLYLESRRRAALEAGEGYGDAASLFNEPVPFAGGKLANPAVAILPLLVVGIVNKLLTLWIPQHYGASHSFDPAVIGSAAPVVQEVSKVAAIWAVEGALLAGIACVLLFAWKPVTASFRRRQQVGDFRRAAGWHEHRLGIRLRRGDRRPARLPGGRQRTGIDPEPAGQRSGHRHCAGRHHRFRVRRHEHRAGGDGGDLHRQRERRRDPDGSPAPGRRDGLRRDGHAAAQRRGDHPACGDRPDPSAGLQGHFRDHLHQDHGGVRGDRPVLRLRADLKSLPAQCHGPHHARPWMPAAHPPFPPARRPPGRSNC
ncbi:GntP family permease [Thermomonas sp.]|uniref:GntP family permease n=1 Tax=Thermomonas sp. TaxID=1971895 RepID=UPI0026240038|nr:GntP family permease [Thermomonas sp.]